MTILRSIVFLAVAAAGLIYAQDAPKVAGTWKMALESKEDLFKGVLGAKPDDPMPAYDWNTKLIHPPVSLPGVAKFV